MIVLGLMDFFTAKYTKYTKVCLVLCWLGRMVFFDHGRDGIDGTWLMERKLGF